MTRVISWLRSVSLRQAIAGFLAAITFLVIPAFSYSPSFQANAETLIAGEDPYLNVDQGTVKRVQEKAEDLGDRSEKRGGRAIGDTGLKNIKKLGENIPETIEMRARTDAKDAGLGDPKEAVDEAGNRAGGLIESAKRAIQDAID